MQRAYFAIVNKTDGLTGGGSDDSIFGERGNYSDCDEEEMEERGVEWVAKEVILRTVGGRVTLGTPLLVVEAGQSLG
jgi:hypothetical protein